MSVLLRPRIFNAAALIDSVVAVASAAPGSEADAEN
jgi:hypothetical protein